MSLAKVFFYFKLACTAAQIYLLSFTSSKSSGEPKIVLTSGLKVFGITFQDAYFGFEDSSYEPLSGPDKMKHLGIELARYLTEDITYLLDFSNDSAPLVVKSNDLWLLARLKTEVNGISYWDLPPVMATKQQVSNVRYIYES